MFDPPSGEHTEFVGANQTVSIDPPETLDVEILSVSYRHELGFTFDDMNITVSTKSFHYSTKYEYAVPRKTHFTVEIGNSLTEDYVNSIELLPKDYKGVFYVENPPSSTTVTFTVKVRERTITTSTNPDGSTGTPIYGEWKNNEYLWTDTVNTSWSWHIQAIRKAVMEGSAVKNSIKKPQI